ncbi:ribosome maturation factor RimP [Desulfobotulus sp.]|uniref:ribosome maturation factor RimP n=1 Tax=Desulfobotulus sp. TaxID=1940337 RepID=UPI002A360D57|nr:ribosome maturation factor RimP [Desulfobotulus sp.]MDY0163700.1 ribosome maturation factor RimP [Desulfobotulus sp.]
MQTENHTLIHRIQDLAQPLLESHGLELVLAEFASENGRRILRILMDKPGGITLDDCARFAREFGYLLDIHMDIPGQYTLEVSSPGINRPLVSPRDFERFAGETVKIRTHAPLEGQRNYKGELLGITEGQVTIKLAERTVAIPYGEIQSARLCRD